MQPLDYEPRQQHKRPTWSFWFAFAAAYLPGALILNVLDDAIHRHVFGHPNDGGIMFLSLMCSPLIALVAGVLQATWPKLRRVGFAAAFAVLGPIVFYLAWVLIDLHVH